MLYLNEEFKKDIQGADPFSYLCSVQGKVYRDVKGRRTIQFQLNDKSYFVKFHFGVGWREIIKNILQLFFNYKLLFILYYLQLLKLINKIS